jgi:cyanophycinase-like exopeptidase
MTRALFIVDGSERADEDDQVLAEFVSRAGGPDALILVCGLATGDAPAVEAEYIDRFTGLGARATHLHVDQPDGQLEKATAVWFAGNDQSALPELLPDRLKDELRSRGEEGLLIGGTSVGVATVLGGAA